MALSQGIGPCARVGPGFSPDAKQFSTLCDNTVSYVGKQMR